MTSSKVFGQEIGQPSGHARGRMVFPGHHRNRNRYRNSLAVRALLMGSGLSFVTLNLTIHAIKILRKKELNRHDCLCYTPTL